MPMHLRVMPVHGILNFSEQPEKKEHDLVLARQRLSNESLYKLKDLMIQSEGGGTE
jgi:hypothetical protein